MFRVLNPAYATGVVTLTSKRMCPQFLPVCQSVSIASHDFHTIEKALLNQQLSAYGVMQFHKGVCGMNLVGGVLFCWNWPRTYCVVWLTSLSPIFTLLILCVYLGKFLHLLFGFLDFATLIRRALL